VSEATIRVLDHGLVRLVDVMGSDAAIVQAARVSYGEGTKTVREDARLIDYLVRNQHTTPLEMVVFKFHVRAPLFVARQWLRHRMASVNEVSGRYSVLKDVFYQPEPGRIQGQDPVNRQGSGEALPPEVAQEAIAALAMQNAEAYAAYDGLLEAGVARELARLVLPLSLYTEWYWRIDLHNLLRFISLRIDAHAQQEIQVYAQALLDLITPHVPAAVAAWEEHVRGGVRLSRTEALALREAKPQGLPASLETKLKAVR
jgi:thymidylate synthase (FAD)